MREYIVKEYDFQDYTAIKDSLSKKDLCEILSYVKKTYVPDSNFSGTEEDFENYKLQMAIYKAIDYISGRNEVVFPDEDR
jgi:hypothetical protein